MKRPRFLPLFVAAALSLCGASCESTNTAGGGQYPSPDGGYNPYGGPPPGQSGYQQYGAPQPYAQTQPKPPYGSRPPQPTYPPQQNYGSQPYGQSNYAQQNPGQQPYQTYNPSPGYTPQSDYAPPSDYAPDPGYGKPKKGSSYGGGGGAYTVRQGDTLYRIALDHGTSVSRLKNANGLVSDVIQPGQQLTLP